MTGHEEENEVVFCVCKIHQECHVFAFGFFS